MSDIHVDKLNNSQLILLVLLISLVVSAAVAVATLSVVYERLALAPGAETESQPTVIRQTINRIIEREPASGSGITNTQSTAGMLTLDTIEQALVQLYFGSQPFTHGMYISPNGHIFAAETLDPQRRYSVLDEAGNPTFFSLLHNGEKYALLAPVDTDTYTTQHYVPLEHSSDILLGQTVVVFGGSGERAQLHTGIVSQKKKVAGETSSFRVSINASEITTTSAVFIENSFVGFAQPYTDWIALPSSTVTTYATKQQAGENTTTPPAESPQ
ncbi:MAG: hypothetical protein OXB96_01835 [Candidatus Kaiserbacteria bacterium]|nr:hypothetical protein [Candidatus Kaiserbacteria bacterium]